MKHIGIIGGGVNGLFSAYYLQQAGCQVSIIENGSFSDGCSYGNAGMIVPSHIVPLAQPGMISKGLRWMMSATSPFYIKPRLNWGLVKWGYLFWKHSTHSHVNRAVPALRDISLLSKSLLKDLAQYGEIAFDYHERGLLMLYKNVSSEPELREEAHLANQAGIEAFMLSGAEVQALEPDVKVSVGGAVYYPGDAHLSPHILMQQLRQYLKQNRVRFIKNQTVKDFEVQGQTLKSVVTDGGSYAFDEVLIASGAWSPLLMQKLGILLPLQGGKGYSFMIENPSKPLQVPAIMLEARATATQMGAQLRFAGTMEIAGTDLSVNMNRVQGIVSSISNYYPDLQVAMPQPAQVWRGLRPCSPDGLPYIGRVKSFKNLSLATGHGMMGLSLGAATGKLMSELLTHRPTSMPIDAFDPMRFS